MKFEINLLPPVGSNEHWIWETKAKFPFRRKRKLEAWGTAHSQEDAQSSAEEAATCLSEKAVRYIYKR